MVFDKLENAKRYYNYSEGVKVALEWLQEHAEALITMEPGRVDIDGDNVYALILDRPCNPDYDAYFEGHRKYLDIHYVADGEELMGWGQRCEMEEFEYNPEVPGEHSKHVRDKGIFFLMRKGDFCLTDYEDIHAPSTYYPESPFLRKICVKVKLV